LFGWRTDQDDGRELEGSLAARCFLEHALRRVAHGVRICGLHRGELELVLGQKAQDAQQ